MDKRALIGKWVQTPAGIGQVTDWDGRQYTVEGTARPGFAGFAAFDPDEVEEVESR